MSKKPALKNPFAPEIRSEVEHEEHWVSVSDLMGGLMMVFLLIAVVYMVQLEIESRKMRDVAVLYDRLRTQLYEDLLEEFGPDLPEWGAELNPDLSLSFYNTDVLFAQGDHNLRPGFTDILDDFFPRYVNIITSPTYRDDILEVRIEGHTSSDWGNEPPEVAYIRNMDLSQARTRTTVEHLLRLPEVHDERDWLKAHLTANGLSSSQPVIVDGAEDPARSRRVEFRLRTDAESRIETLLQGQ
ncbi:OmpA family protein [Marinimicrobium sp. ABcell2]|uniref:OmpA family protein n=1 Tax=Marinimicrobium sp. ABcell2 TaxID=3069751 RepID=UPI0027B212B4|nr:OmpA family protein [Marinimicrobium sp. ABcell2]MDQ2075286.1 OmpA family protein [Marinimicrobium sp. ABcell2]